MDTSLIDYDAVMKSVLDKKVKKEWHSQKVSYNCLSTNLTFEEFLDGRGWLKKTSPVKEEYKVNKVAHEVTCPNCLKSWDTNSKILTSRRVHDAKDGKDIAIVSLDKSDTVRCYSCLSDFSLPDTLELKLDG